MPKTAANAGGSASATATPRASTTRGGATPSLGDNAPDANGRSLLDACARSASRSTRSFTTYALEAHRQNAANAHHPRIHTSGWVACASRAGTNSNRFFVHWWGRSAFISDFTRRVVPGADARSRLMSEEYGWPSGSCMAARTLPRRGVGHSPGEFGAGPRSY